MHGANFGAFTNAKGDAVYELADFDESLILGTLFPNYPFPISFLNGMIDYQYDLYRLGSYMALLGGYLGRPAEVYVGWIKVSDSIQKPFCILLSFELTCKTFITSYLNSISNLALNDISLNTSFTSSTTEGVLKKFLITASSKSGLDLLDSFSSTQPGTPNRQFVMDSTKGIVPLESTIKALIKKYWPHYINSVNLGGNQKNSTPLFAIKDIARRINAGIFCP